MSNDKAIAKLDASGRVHIPKSLKKRLLDGPGSEVFVTSIDDERVLIFPLQTWLRQEDLAAQGAGNKNVEAYLRHANAQGFVTRIDVRSRIVRPILVRKIAGLKRDVCLEVDRDHIVLCAMGTVYLLVPKVRKGGYVPFFISPVVSGE